MQPLPKEQLIKAEQAMQTGHYQEAISVLASLPEAEKKPAIQLNIALAYRDNNDLKNAKKTITKLLRNHHNEPNAQSILTTILLLQNDIKKATELVQKAYNKAPHLPWCKLAKANLIRYSNLQQSLPHYLDLCKHHPTFIEGLLETAHAFSLCDQFEHANQYYKQALNIAPHNVKVLLTSSYFLLQMKNHMGVEELMRAALTLNSNRPDIFLLLAQAQIELGKYKEALQQCENAIALNPKSAKAYFTKAQILEKHNQTKYAKEAIEKALKFESASVELQSYLGLLESYLKNYDRARELFNTNLKKVTCTEVKGTMLMQLGQIEEAQNNFEQAFKYYCQAQQIFSENNKNNPIKKSEGTTLLKKIKTNYNNALPINKYEAVKTETPALVFLVGFPRSGTTLTEQMLSTHKNIKVSSEEPFIYDTYTNMGKLLNNNKNYPESLNTLSAKELTILRNSYLEKLLQSLKQPTNTKLTLVDKNPYNIIYLDLIYRLFPNANILTILRDPRDCCISAFFQAFVHNIHTSHTYTMNDTCNYYRHIMDIYQLHKKHLALNIHEFKYEDMIENTEKTARGIISFLGQEWSDSLLQYHQKQFQRVVQTPSYKAVSQPIYKTAIARWKAFAPYIKHDITQLEPFIKAFSYK